MQKENKVVALVLARMGAGRLPGKPLKPIGDKPLLLYLIDRLSKTKKLDKIVVATTTHTSDDEIVEVCKNNGVAFFRGSENDVTKRLVSAFEHFSAKTGVVIFGDCPLIDPGLVDEIVSYYQLHSEKYDFVGNDLSTSYPPGMEVEVFSVDALKHAAEIEVNSEIREHGTLVLRSNPKDFQLKNMIAPEPLKRPDISLEVDEPLDLQVLNEIVQSFSGKDDFSLSDIIKLFDQQPEQLGKNKHIERRWKKYRAED